jgi:hypothetical protein
VAAAQATPAKQGSKLGDLYDGITTLQGHANELFAMYEGDASAYDLSSQAAQVESLAMQLRVTLSVVGDALQNLEG